MDKTYRHELKFILNSAQATLLKYKLSLVMDIDSNSKNEDNSYFVRSLYFDDIYNSAYNEKMDGLKMRFKYRIRTYNLDKSFIRLEKKEKNRDLTHKEQCKITKKDYDNIINNKLHLINTSKDKLLEEFVLLKKTKRINPDVVVDYKRIAYTYPNFDVRITFDEEICSGRFNYNLFDKDMIMYSVLKPNEVVLEVKFNDIIPDHIVKVINSVPSIRLALSKFALCKEVKEV